MSAVRLHRPIVDVPKLPRGCCGPFALAALTGDPLSAFLPAGRKKSLRWMDILLTLEARGVKYTRRYFAPEQRPTIQRALRPVWHGLLAIDRHCMAFDGLLVLDTCCRRLTWVYDHPMRQRHVMFIVTIEGGAR
jgi:hypothetical protein